MPRRNALRCCRHYGLLMVVVVVLLLRLKGCAASADGATGIWGWHWVDAAAAAGFSDFQSLPPNLPVERRGLSSDGHRGLRSPSLHTSAAKTVLLVMCVAVVVALSMPALVAVAHKAW